jgi:Tol biopolymer transport system component
MLTTIAAILLLAAPVHQSDTGKIVFVSDRDGNNEIYTMDADGTNQKRLTFNGAQDVQPCWSPDGLKIAWASNRSGNWNIWEMDADGSNQVDLSGSKDRQDSNPMWANDPGVITFVSNKRIYMIQPSGDNILQLFDMPLVDDAEPSVTLNDQKFVFRVAGGHLLIKQGYDSNTLVKLTYGQNGVPPQAFNPTWNTDGSDIAFDSGGLHPKIFIMDARDFSCDPVVFDGDGSHPRFAKGDDSIVFTSPTGEGKGSDVCIVDIDAVHKVHGLPKPTNLTHTAGNDFDPDYWEQPSGGVRG